MSERAEATQLRERIAGKWQVPLLFMAIALLVGSLARIDRPEATHVSNDTAFQRIEAQLAGQMYSLAIEDSRRVLAEFEGQEEVGEEAEQDRGRAYLMLARALAMRAEHRGGPDASTAQSILAAYDRVEDLGQSLDWSDCRHVGLAHEGLEQFDAAVTAYRLAVPDAGDQALDLRRRIIELEEYPLKQSTEYLHTELDYFLADAGERPDLLHWATTRKVDLLGQAGRDAEALTLLDDLRPVWEPTEYRPQFDYLVAWTLQRIGRFDDAEATLRDLRNRLTVRDDIYAMSGWLLGRVVLGDGAPQRPAEALSFFREVVNTQPSGLYADASRLGMAEALAMLERYDEALERYRPVLETLPEHGDSPILNPDVVRASMTVVAQSAAEPGTAEAFERALAFVGPARNLVPAENIELLSVYHQRVGDWRSALARALHRRADQLPDDPEHQTERAGLYERSRDLFESAGETFVELAQINTLNEPRAAAATWRAADRFDEAGDRNRTIEILREFVRERPGHDLVPRALLRLGQSLQALGRFEEAIAAYQENLRRFPRTPDAGSALVPLARCFMALGPEYYDQADKTCRIILDDSPIFTPEAPEFADALFLRADLLSRQGRFEDAIPQLREAIERYPDDPRVVRAEFLLGDAYRQSGLALREDLARAKFVGEKRRMQAEHIERLEQATDLFGRLVVRYEDRAPDDLNRVERLFLRLARLYEADCLFELRRYREALKRYERAAWVYRDRPSALASYVQIVNCHAYLGEPTEARAALRRAQYLLKTIPENEFVDATLTGTRADWEQYFTWLEQSELF